MTISERFFELLDKNGTSAYALCHHLGIGTSTVNNWKLRDTDPPTKYLVPICEFLGCSLDYLLTGQEAKKAPVPEISENGREMLELFDQLPDRDQLLLIGRLREMVSPMLEVEKKDLASSAEQAG